MAVEAIFAAAFIARLAELAQAAPGGTGPWGAPNGNRILTAVQIYDVKLARYVPYPGVLIELYWDTPRFLYASLLTRETGDASFLNLPDGTYLIVARPPEGVQEATATVTGGGTTSRVFSVQP